MIPKIIHYCWFGDNRLPQESEAYIKEWQDLHPDWNFIFWNENNSPLENPYLKNAYKEKNWANMSNFIRLFSLREQGGIYLDTDIKLLKPLDSLLTNSCFLGFEEGNENNDSFWINNAVCGAEPSHPFIVLLHTHLENLFDGSEMANLSSPRMTTEILKSQYGLKQYGYQTINGVTLYPIDYFYPIHYNETYKLSNFSEHISVNTIAVHMWGRSWLSSDLLIRMVDDLQYEISHLTDDKKKLTSNIRSLQEFLSLFSSCLKLTVSQISKKASENKNAVFAELIEIKTKVSSNAEYLSLLKEKERELSVVRSEERKTKQELFSKLELIKNLKETNHLDHLSFNNTVGKLEKEAEILKVENKNLKLDIAGLTQRLQKKEHDFSNQHQSLMDSLAALKAQTEEYEQFKKLQEANNIELLNLLQAKANNYKSQLSWYKATYENRKTLGIVKDRMKKVFKRL